MAVQTKPYKLKIMDVATACGTAENTKDFSLKFDKVTEYNPEIVFMYLFEEGKRLLLIFERANDHKGSYRAEIWSLQSKERIHQKYFEMPTTTENFNEKEHEHSGDFKIVQMRDGPCLAVSLVKEFALYNLETLEMEEDGVLEKGIHTDIAKLHTSPCGKILVTEDKLKVSIWDIAQKQ